MINIEVGDFYSWRKTARQLLQRNIKPDQISWNGYDLKQCSFNFDEPTEYLTKPIIFDDLRISKGFLNLASNVACFRDSKRWALLYSVAWRIIFETPEVLKNVIDQQIAELISMQKAVSRDKHKMKAFVRFKRVDIGSGYYKEIEKQTGFYLGSTQTNCADTHRTEIKEYLVAWFEPEHLILRDMTSFFIKRFANINWSILTPDLCAHWDGENIKYSPGIDTKIQGQDELEKLWLEYYKSTFNPARLKVKAMQSEMPKKYWANLPEAILIEELIRNAQTRTNEMISQNYLKPLSKMTKSTYIKEQQEKLRGKA